MLKKLQNKPEKLTHKYLDGVSKKYGAQVFPKIGLADVFEITRSGISDELYNFALKAHFDTIVYNSDLAPLFAVEFDGRTHTEDFAQIQRDIKKDTLCEHFDFPLLRINDVFIDKQYGDGELNLLSWLIEVWFAHKWFEKELETGGLPPDEPFSPRSFQSISGLKGEFPLWLSRGALGKIVRLNMAGQIEDSYPATAVYIDQYNDYHSLAWVVIEDSIVAFTKKKMSGQHFPVPIFDLLEDITVVDLSEKLTNILDGKDFHQTINQLNAEINNHQSQYTFVSGGGNPHEKITNWGVR